MTNNKNRTHVDRRASKISVVNLINIVVSSGAATSKRMHTNHIKMFFFFWFYFSRTSLSLSRSCSTVCRSIVCTLMPRVYNLFLVRQLLDLLDDYIVVCLATPYFVLGIHTDATVFSCVQSMEQQEKLCAHHFGQFVAADLRFVCQCVRMLFSFCFMPIQHEVNKE